MTKKQVFKIPQFTVAHIASEVEPFSKTGGLGNVLGSLPKAHAELGSNVIVITPLYEKLIDSKAYNLELIDDPEQIEITEGIWEQVSFRKGQLGDRVPVYFVESSKLFGSQENLYGAENDNARFLFFDVAALYLLKKLNIQPDIINCHDWHTGFIPYFLKGRYKRDPFWEYTATVFTIHNLTYQLGHNWWEIPAELRDDGHTRLPSFIDSEALERINITKRAILNADIINTVSETYREEILTKDFGQELHRVLNNRKKIVFGIVNGIDYNEFNPLTDTGLVQHYSYKSVDLRKKNKKAVQQFYNLPLDAEVPLICTTSRITEQKGFLLLVQIARVLLRMGIQIIVMGDGDEKLIRLMEKIQKEFPKQFVVTPFNQERETLLYAGSDMVLLPSRFEPCGINQMIALRYGCIPIVHHIGGLVDTVVNYDPQTKNGNGFTFKRYNRLDFLVAITRALETYKHKRAWKELMISSLREANSWILPALKYLYLYETTRKQRKQNTK